MKWEEKHKPQKFGEVFGQDSATRQLAGLVRHGRVSQNVALVGAVGSGKTSLINLFARAMNCKASEPDGSPCGVCESCRNPSEYLHEYDCAGKSRSSGDLVAWVKAKMSRLGTTNIQIIFLDEVHAVSFAEQTSLLISVQDPGEGVVFCIATTERGGLLPAFLSRFLEIGIQNFTPRVAFDYLENIASRESLSIDPEAIHLLVAARPPYARDLISALEGLARLERHIDAVLVKHHYELGIVDHLPRYVAALASGDSVDQLNSLNAWPETAVRKRNWITQFVTCAYSNEVLGVSYSVHPVIDHLAKARSTFVDQLRERLQLDDAALRIAFERMMDYWSRSKVISEEGAQLAIVLFGSVIARELCGFEHSSRRCKLALSTESTSGASNFDRQPSIVERPGKARFLTEIEMREVINRVSFFCQHYGRAMNLCVRLEFAQGTSDAMAAEQITQFLRAIESRCGVVGGTCAGLAVLERDGTMLVARLLGYLEEEVFPAFEEECRAAQTSMMCTLNYETAPSLGSIDFQWKVVREICAACEPEVSNEGRDIRRKLSIPKSEWRSSGPIDCERVYCFGHLSSSSIEAACASEMLPLSAFDAEAWSWLWSGWELEEYFDRRNEVHQRSLKWETLNHRWKHDAERLALERKELLLSWRRAGAERRPRRYRTWRNA